MDRGKTFTATGSWRRTDDWALNPAASEGIDSPVLTRQSGRNYAKGLPASVDGTFVPVGDLAQIESFAGALDEPAVGLAQFGALQIGPTEEFAPGRSGLRYDVDLVPGHFGRATHLRAWEDSRTGLLGAVTWSYASPIAGNYAPMPQGGTWEGPASLTREVTVRVEFSAYGHDSSVVIPNLATGGS